MRLLLIRHGETTGDIEDRYGGSYNDHLTALGRQQLQETAKKLEGGDCRCYLCQSSDKSSGVS